MLDAFLGDNHVDLGENNIMQPAFSKGDSRAKQQFIPPIAVEKRIGLVLSCSC